MHFDLEDAVSCLVESFPQGFLRKGNQMSALQSMMTIEIGDFQE
jgi:hypothetical protein